MAVGTRQEGRTRLTEGGAATAAAPPGLEARGRRRGGAAIAARVTEAKNDGECGKPVGGGASGGGDGDPGQRFCAEWRATDGAAVPSLPRRGHAARSTRGASSGAHEAASSVRGRCRWVGLPFFLSRKRNREGKKNKISAPPRLVHSSRSWP